MFGHESLSFPALYFLQTRQSHHQHRKWSDGTRKKRYSNELDPEETMFQVEHFSILRSHFLDAKASSSLFTYSVFIIESPNSDRSHSLPVWGLLLHGHISTNFSSFLKLHYAQILGSKLFQCSATLSHISYHFLSWIMARCDTVVQHVAALHIQPCTFTYQYPFNILLGTAKFDISILRSSMLDPRRPTNHTHLICPFQHTTYICLEICTLLVFMSHQGRRCTEHIPRQRGASRRTVVFQTLRKGKTVASVPRMKGPYLTPQPGPHLSASCGSQRLYFR